MCGIYKITNLINKKVYIGQSTNIIRRWNQHKNYNNEQFDYPLYRAFRKYGLENFSFEILEECEIDNLNDKEKYWIEYYNSYKEGYNQTNNTNGGNGGVKLNIDLVNEIIDELLFNENIIHKNLAERYGVSIHAIKDINVGRTWFNDKLNYPLHSTTLEKNICNICGKEITQKAQSCIECSGKLKRKVEWPSKEQLYKDLKESNFVQVGKKYGVTDNAIRKWCKSYEMSTLAKDYK